MKTLHSCYINDTSMCNDSKQLLGEQ